MNQKTLSLWSLAMPDDGGVSTSSKGRARLLVGLILTSRVISAQNKVMTMTILTPLLTLLLSNHEPPSK